MSLEILMKLYCKLFSTFTVCAQKFLDSNTFSIMPWFGANLEGTSKGMFLKGQNSATLPPTCSGDYLVTIKGFSKNFITAVRMSAK